MSEHKRWTHTLCSGLAALAGLAAMTAPATAGIPFTVWVGPSGGSWFDAANWSFGLPDGNTRVLIDGGLVVYPGGQFVSTSELTVGGSATGRQAGLGLAGPLTSIGVTLGLQAGSTGVVTVGNGGRLFSNFGPLTVGAAGTGTLVVSSGGEVVTNGGAAVGQQPGGNGSLRVNGGTVSSQGAQTIDVGAAGNGLLSISGGGEWTGIADTLELARLGGHAEVQVAGAGSRLQVGTLVGRADAQVAVERGGTIGANQILGGAALWSVLPQGLLTATTLTLADDSLLRFTLSGPLPQGMGRVTAGTLERDGTLALLLADGFAPALGDSFALLSWFNASGRFDRLDLPALATGLRWDDSTLYTLGTLQVAAVPEPASALLLALGVLTVALGGGSRRCGRAAAPVAQAGASPR